MENAGSKILETPNRNEGPMRGIGAAAAGGGSGSSLSLAACRPETTGCSTVAARGPAPGNVPGDRCERLSIISLPHQERRPRSERLHLQPTKDAAGEVRG